MSTSELKNKLTKSTSPVVQFRDYLEKGKTQIANALPKHLSADRMIRLACTEFSKNPSLQKCDATSMFGAIIQSAQLGLEIGVLGQAYLVPFKNNKTGKTEVTFIPGYKGLINLARRSGEVSSIETHIVYANDEFDITLGMDTTIKHKPFLDGDRGAIKLVYGVAKFKDGGHHFEWMSIADVHKIRARSKASSSGPWVTDYEQMIRKTVIRRMMNYLPMSIELAAAIDLSDAADNGKKAAIDSDFVVVTDDEPIASEPITVDQHTGEIIETNTNQEEGDYTDLKQAINECESLADLSRIINELKPDVKNGLTYAIRKRQEEIKEHNHIG